jgi:hypothetical protein
MNETRYPVYVLSKGRADCCLTARCFTRDRLRFFLVVEAQEEQEYRKYYPHAEYLILPPEATGQGAVRVRQWIWEHSSELGAERHWEFDDNIREIGRLNKGYRIKCQAGIALNVIEDFTDRYTNIAIAGLNYQMFVINTTSIPYYLNCHVYSAMLIKNNIPCRWRLRYNADTDLCLQALTSNWCTVNFNVFYGDKQQTMKMKGGNTSRYQGDGRLIMARTLEEMWPEHVETKMRYGRPQHVIKHNWKQFKQPLIRRSDIDWEAIEQRTWSIPLKKRAEVKSAALQKFYNDVNKPDGNGHK